MMEYRQIKDKLSLEFGWIVSDPTVWRSMNRLGIHGHIRHRKIVSNLGSEHTRYANVLNRDFKPDMPMEKIVTDITYINYKGKRYYLAAYLDLFNNEIVEWELSNKFDNLIVMRHVERLLKNMHGTPSPLAQRPGCLVLICRLLQPLKNIMRFKVCQELVTLTTMLLWRVFGADSKMLCNTTFSIRRLMIRDLLLLWPFIISTTNGLFGS